jgi:DNA-binding Lrp family transcriptional regulator
VSVVTAYIMVKANTGEADRLKTELQAIDGIEDAHIVAGDVDFIVKVRVDSPGEVKDVAATKIQLLDGVEDTQTYIAMD